MWVGVGDPGYLRVRSKGMTNKPEFATALALVKELGEKLLICVSCMGKRGYNKPVTTLTLYRNQYN